MISLRNNSIKNKLTWMSMLASASALLLACAVFVVLEIVLFRTTTVRSLTIRAEILGANSVSALMFSDPHSGEATLASLKADPSIISAAIYDRHGKLFAGYGREQKTENALAPKLQEAPPDSYRFEGGALLLFHPIIFEGERQGTVVLHGDLDAIYVRVRQYVLVTVIVLAVSLLLALLISARLQRSISGTVLHLAETARAISSRKDYSVRATPAKSRDELALLTDTFNEMLSQIQERDGALEKARQEVEQKVQERTAELRQSEEKFRLLVDRVNDYAIVTLDPVGRITTWNAGAERIKGYSADEIIGKHFSSFYLEEEAALGKPDLLLRTAAVEGRCEAEGWRVRKDGSRFWANVIVTALRDPQGQLLGFSKITRDLTERKRAEEGIKKLNEDLERRSAALEITNNELESFTYSVSHDLRAPLRHIDGFSRLLVEEHGKELSGEAQEYLTFVREGTREMSQLVDDLLNLARIGRRELNSQVTGLSSIVEEVLSGLRKDLKERNIEWKIQSLPFAECDPSLMKQVFTNLLSNAVKYSRTRNPSIIEAGSFEKDGRPVFFVRDNGIGFDMKHAGKLFGVFQRLHRQEDFEGTGVGLAIVHRIIQKHGGKVWAEAEINKGATFYFTLEEPKESETKTRAEEKLTYAG